MVDGKSVKKPESAKSKGSKIIVTTRREHLMKAQKLYKLHEVKELNDDESLELFSWHAFRQNHPIEDKDFTITVLDGCDFYTEAGIDNLIDRCLLIIDQKNKQMMHQLLQDMAREIVRQESTEEPEKRSRLWHHKHAFNVLIEKIGTETVEGLILNMNGFNEEEPSRRRLRILHLYNVRLTGYYEEFPKKLRWLCWHGFPLKSIPNDFCLESLVALDMSYSN
ncbi:hypothetical protein CsSME_00024869 [Camellia sinensis var. sinensis]